MGVTDHQRGHRSRGAAWMQGIWDAARGAALVAGAGLTLEAVGCASTVLSAARNVIYQARTGQYVVRAHAQFVCLHPRQASGTSLHSLAGVMIEAMIYMFSRLRSFLWC